jgi:hypothetical protein
MAKYTVDYCNASTGYGWSQKYDRLDEFEDFINEHRRDPLAYINVWDSELKAYIYMKGYGFKPDVDLLRNPLRDMRTTTREALKGGA